MNSPNFTYTTTGALEKTAVFFTTGSEKTEKPQFFGLDLNPYGKLLRSFQSGSGTERYLSTQHERDHETISDNTSGTGYTNAGARLYDSDIVRWLTLDPLAADLPSWSPYNYVVGNPVTFIDPDGRFPYTFHVRSFHPDATFGGGFMGDNRGFSNDPNASARIAHQFTFDPSTGQSSNRGFANNFSMHAAGLGASRGGWGLDHATPTEKGFNVSGQNGSYDIKTGFEGANPLLPGSPDIDVNSSFSITENLDKGVLSISAAITGDNFPSAEAFVMDASGKNSVFIGVSHLSDKGLRSLFGDNYREMINADFNININDEGHFTGVSVGDQSFSIDDWNSQFE